MSAFVPRWMTAVEISHRGRPDVLTPVRRVVPAPRSGEILVRVAAAGVNRADILQRLGRYPPPPGASDLPGLEVSGTVAAVGSGPSRWSVGEAVCALISGGGYAEYCVVPGVQALPQPIGLDMNTAAALPEAFFTVWGTVFERARLQREERLLVHGGGGGIGTTAIQLGVAFGAEVFATAGGAKKCAACRRLGAAHVFDYHTEDFEAALAQATGGDGVDVILDMAGGDYLDKNIRALRHGGRLALIAFLRGSRAEISLQPVLTRGLTVFGSTLRARSVEEKGALAAALESNVWPRLATGKLAPVVDSILPLEQAADAHARLESGAHFGKIVLRVSRDLEPGLPCAL